MGVSKTVNIGIHNTQITKTKSEESRYVSHFFLRYINDTSDNFVFQLTKRLPIRSGNQHNFHMIFELVNKRFGSLR